MSCPCRCHVGGSYTCDVGPEQPGGNQSCTPTHNSEDEAVSNLCERCGAFGDLPHGWVEGDCILPHRNHSRHLSDGTHICQPCINRWTEWLTETSDLYATLGHVLLAGDVPDDTAEHKHVKKQPASPSPLRLDAWALIHGQLNAVIDPDGDGHPQHTWLEGMPDVPVILTNWAQAIYDTLYENATAPNTVTGAAAICSANLHTLANLPDCDTFDAELRWVRNALRRAHGIRDPDPVCRCIEVGCKGHVWRTEHQPTCDRCGRRYGKLDLVRARGHALNQRRTS